MRKVVGPEAEELGVFGDLFRSERRARDLDHGADEILELCLLLLGDLLGHAVDDLDLKLELLGKTNQRNHHLRAHFDAFGLDLRGGLEDRASLHFRDFRIDDAEPATRGDQASGLNS